MWKKSSGAFHVFMTDTKVIDPTYCGWDSAQYLIFSDNVFGSFIYYSHLFPALIVFILGAYVAYMNFQNRASKALLVMTVAFSLWCYVDLILWATEKTHYTMFFWSTLVYLDVFIYLGALYFVYAFITDRYPSWRAELFIFALLIPIFLFAHTNYNLIGFDYTNCYREALEGPLWFYIYIIEAIVITWIVVFGIWQYVQTRDAVRRQQISIVTFATTLFLLMFSLGNIVGSIEIDWELGQYGLFGAPIFVAVLVYLFVKYHSLEMKVVATEVLVIALWLLLLSLIFLRSMQSARPIIFITLFVFAFFGFQLIRSVRHEIDQRKRIETLADNLKHMNERLTELDKLKTEFVSIASHQMRSPLTAIEGYSSMILEGTYGPTSRAVREAVSKIFRSSKVMSVAVDDFLNVTRIEQGRMKLNLEEFDFASFVHLTYEEFTLFAQQKGIALVVDAPQSGVMIKGDKAKLKQVLSNLIDNALKYTKQGTVTIRLTAEKNENAVILEVSDTGIGIPENEQAVLFTKFNRASNANSMSVQGSGLGLYIVKQLVGMHHGKISCTSHEGEGTTFRVSLPLLQTTRGA